MSAAFPHRSRRMAASACLVALPLLAGCMSLDSSTTIVDDQEIHTMVDVGVSNEVVNTYGLNVRTICEPFVAALPGGAVASPYTASDGVHCRITATSTLVQMQATPNSAMTITHADHAYRFSFSPGQANLGGVSMPGLTTGVDSLRVQVTFPGRVLSASTGARVHDRTVTWNQPADITRTLSASGRDQASGSHGLLRWLPAAVSLLLALIAAAVLLHERRQRSSRMPVSSPEPMGASPASMAAMDAHRPTPQRTGFPVSGMDAGESGSSSTGSHAWTPPTPAGEPTSPPSPAPSGEDGAPHQVVPHETASAPAASPPPSTPQRPADPWGGRSPWQRPE